MQIRLKREAKIPVRRSSLIRIRQIVVNRPCFAEVPIQRQPPEYLHATLHIDIAAEFELVSDPGFMSPAVIDSQESLPRKIHPYAGDHVSFVPVLNLIASYFVPGERSKTFQPGVAVLWIEIQFA